MSDSRHHVRLVSSARTSVGQVRENNEDNIHLWGRAEFALAVVADGMGGAVAGEEASRIAVEAVEAALVNSEYANRESLETLSDEFIASKMQEAIHSANANIVARTLEKPEMRGMGTTITLAFVRGTQAILAHVGDSRAYLVEARAQRITQVTADHSFVEALVAAGHLTQEQAEAHPMKNVLYRALGQSEDIDVDVYEVQMSINDRLVLCSDGLTRHVKAPEIGEITLRNAHPEDAAAALIDLANRRGGEDNVSVIVIKVENDSKQETGEISTTEMRPVNLNDEDTLRMKEEMFSEIPIIGDSADDTIRPTPAH
ncbi:MAG: Stp1/IreP family PP2C-type Ser/Thr phosphatase [Anaerolineae bacterium]|nr:Stp1/IreP family PP2C-type Ser/Thr phosphatase [Anaerolineae bacterium]